ncbi:MAG: hypothetical protein NTU89_01125 [Candidatus Dependentiae bacterium]|nr:hypothetical protein [Candidatus Dependentiae bacterium]
MISKHNSLFLICSLFFIETHSKPGKRVLHNTSQTLNPQPHIPKINNTNSFYSQPITEELRKAVIQELKLTTISMVASCLFIGTCIMFDTNKS